MKDYWRGLAIAAVLVPALGSAAMRPERNAFLDRRVTTTSGLVHQVRTDPAVRDRYLRHFGMTEGELYSYIGSLRLERMPADETVSVYAVPESGVLRVHKQKLHKGELVFVDSHGRRILLARCGNPLAQGPSNTRNMAVSLPEVVAPETFAMKALPDVVAEPVLVDNPQGLVAMTTPPDTLADVISVVPPVTTTVITAPPAPPAAPPVVVPSGGSRGAFGLIPLLGGGALIGILASHHGGSPPPPVVPTPEPAGIVLLAAGAAVLLVKRQNR